MQKNPTRITRDDSIPCGCERCLCRRGPRCRCHDYNALLALALWDFGLMVRRWKLRSN